MRPARPAHSVLRFVAGLALLVGIAAQGRAAFAQEGESDAPVDDQGGEDKGSEEGEAGQSAEDAEDAAPEDQGPSIWAGPYERTPYAKPAFSAVVFGEQGAASVGVGVGARAGLRYQNDHPGAIIVGDAYVSGQYILGGVEGWDVRIGDMTGPFYKFIGIGTGPEIAINQFGYDAVDLGQASTLRWTLSPYILTKVFDLSVGVAPGWYVAGEREKLSPAMSEYSLFASTGVKLSKVRVSVNWSRLELAQGRQQGFGFGFGI
jgi:hypothetical protein